MITDKHKAEIQEKLCSFIIKMHEWEIECNKIANDTTLTFEEQFQKQKELVEKIFEVYCTQKERKQGRPTTISYGSDGSYIYDPQLEIVSSIEGTIDEKKVIVYTESTGSLPMLYQYLMLHKNRTWLIDSKKRYSDWKKKWVIESL